MMHCGTRLALMPACVGTQRRRLAQSTWWPCSNPPTPACSRLPCLLLLAASACGCRYCSCALFALVHPSATETPGGAERVPSHSMKFSLQQGSVRLRRSARPPPGGRLRPSSLKVPRASELSTA